MATPEEQEPRTADEWRVEVRLEADEHGHSVGERLRALDLDNDARKRLGGSVIVTRDGPHLFFYAWHEQSAREAERVVRELLEEDKLAGEVTLMRWHPAAEQWRPASEPLPETDAELAEEERLHTETELDQHAQTGSYDWEVVIELDDLRSTRELANRLRKEGLPIKRRWKYVLVGAPTEEKAIEVGEMLEREAPEGSRIGVRANPDDFPLPVFVQLGNLKPGFVRDLGL